MNRRHLLQHVVAGTVAPATFCRASGGDPLIDAVTAKDWLARWQSFIRDSVRTRYCDKETGEQVGWLISPHLSGFHYGYLATHDEVWVELLVDWTDAWIKRGVKEPDGFIGWPKLDPDGHSSGLYVDSLLGEAMALRPVILLSGEILKTPALEKKWGVQARAYIQLAHELFEKWDSRGCWRDVQEGGIWVAPLFGIDRQTGKWTAGFEDRGTAGFSHPDNKQNEIARWLLAMYDVTQKTVYRDRAGSWFHLMRSRMKLRQDGKYFVWNYWEPAGPWDYKSDHSTKHWVGVHPNGGYYHLDVGGIVEAMEHGLVFTKQDIARLIATNRDFMWNKDVSAAKFQRIDGGLPDARWKNNPGSLWTALVPYDETLRKIFAANHRPAGWGGLSSTPWSLAKRMRI